MNLSEKIDLIAIAIDDLGHIKVPLHLLMHQVDSVQSYLGAKVADQEMGFFTKEIEITPSDAGTDLPVDFARVMDISVDDSPLDIIQASQHHSLDGNGYEFISSHYAYIRNNKVFFGQNVGTPVDLVYVRRLPHLCRGFVSAATATTVTLPAVPVIGRLNLSTDYYKNATIVIVSGTGSGQERVFTAYDGTTRVGTVATWTTVPDATSAYEIKCELPEDPDFHTLLCDMVSLRFNAKGVNAKGVREEMDEKLGLLSARNSNNPWMTI